MLLKHINICDEFVNTCKIMKEKNFPADMIDLQVALEKYVEDLLHLVNKFITKDYFSNDNKTVNRKEPSGDKIDGKEYAEYPRRSSIKSRIELQNSERHIHPCICDLSKEKRAAIEEFRKEKAKLQLKFVERVKQVEDELLRYEEELAERRKAEKEEKELYEDEYLKTGKKKKRKVRSARRVSKVSIGIKQIINIRNSPKLGVKENTTSKLRALYSRYCKPSIPPYLPSVKSNFQQKNPDILVINNNAQKLRTISSTQFRKALNMKVSVRYPNRPEWTVRGSYL